jgi:hypothetical protein
VSHHIQFIFLLFCGHPLSLSRSILLLFILSWSCHSTWSMEAACSTVSPQPQKSF